MDETTNPDAAAAGGDPDERAQAGADRPLRRDAERNRQRILEGAAAAFAELGLDVTTDEIARRAGVGIGTFYRRFPTKELLIEALFEDRVGKLVELAEECLRAEDPWAGLVSFLDQATARQVADRGLKELVFSTAHGRARIAADRDRIGPLFMALVTRAQDAGALRADIAGTDLGLVQLMLISVADFTREEAPQAWRRFLTILLDGLRTSRDAPSALPLPPLDPAQIARAMECHRPHGR
ncbi:TetR/AcrR family transcriptional regulator [Frankia sp. CNm7]|uniref:TetR/AcrR family transcriptional regulator n=1 Tax=Frankia nepalensis TaxID=1836974 RepID=A0A937USB8_9ACTN|nr:TetR/AcrR family transcriptional regulator [Frankia nepalensis]MBL7502132.1 TetR/AcrR family transcriptional regulator [Frankia nepalensis]MBL7516167.1 TetR/AcrR family transcriptional regulator [Frankia nepalensis]MBL7519512.1 TetR/AcrR family transcriptional regulator [Frankia nepalensis]MBL7633704.1 TetR/AcrR family transcriptional regulator [Frankia nepalensis]